MSKDNTLPTPRILITRLSHIGDCILTLPMVSAIRKKHPDAFIAWAVESPADQLLKLHPDIDELITVPKNWLKHPGCWKSLFARLRKPKFEISIDPQGITKSAALARISGAKTRIGIRGRWGRELSPYLNNCLVETKSSHLVDRSLELLVSLGIKKPKIEFRLPICTQSQQAIRRFLTQPQMDQPFVIINPGASWQSKRWVTERFATVADFLFRKYKYRSIITWAGQEEKAMAERIAGLAPEASRVADKTSLTELAALCQEACFFIGCDTGPLHLAAAMGTNCVGLYGPTLPEDSGAYGRQHIAVQRWYQSGTSRQRRSAPNDAMRDILVLDVTDACDRMIARQRDALRLAA